MRKKLTAICAVFLSAAALTACGRKVNRVGITKEHMDYLKYTFGDSCTVNMVDNSSGTASWDVTFPDYSGGECTRELKTGGFTEEDREFYANEKVKINSDIFDFAASQAGEKAAAEFYDKVFSEYFSGEYDAELSVWNGEYVSSSVTANSPLCGHDKEGTVIAELADPTGGFRYTDCDLKSFTNNMDFQFTVTMTVLDESKLEENTEKFHAMTEGFKAYTGSPKNFLFVLRKKYTDEKGKKKQTIVERTAYINGEPFDLNGAKNYSDALLEKYAEIYGIAIAE